MTPENLSQVVSITVEHFKLYDRLNWPSLCDQYAELKDDDKYFLEALNKDVASEIELNKKISEALSEKQEKPLTENGQLTLLGLSGHIARLEHRSSFLSAIVAIFSLAIAALSIDGLKNGLYVLALSLCLLPVLVMKWNVRKRAWMLSRAVEHLKHIVD